MNGDRAAGKPEKVARPSVAGAQLTEETGKNILAALADLARQIANLEQKIRPANSA